MEATARTGFEAKRRLLGRAVANAFVNDDSVDPAVLLVRALSLLEPVHVRALIRLETAIATAEPDGLNEAIRRFNVSQPTPVLATLENSGVIIRGTFAGGGFGASDISNFGRYVLTELRAVADEEMERLAD